MARVVCQVLVQPDRLTFLWSQGTTPFEPYHKTGANRHEFLELARRADGLLGKLAAAPAGGEAALALARAGHDLYQHLFQADDAQQAAAQEIRGWLAGLSRDGAVDTLEILGDGADLVPWNVLTERAPDEASFLAGGETPEAWQAFWGTRYNLITGRRVRPLTRRPLVEKPNVLLVVDTAARAALPADRQNALREFAQANSFTVVESARDLADHLRGSTPDLLYVFCRLRDGALLLGEDTVATADLRQALRGERPVTPGRADTIVFLNASRGGDEGADVAAVVAALGCRASLAPRLPAPPDAADRLGLDFLQGFLKRGEPAGRLMQQLRGRHAPAGLLYAAACLPGLRVVGAASSGEAIKAEGQSAAAPAAADGAEELEPLPLPENPYFPLLPYDSQDRPLFVGRESDTEAFAELLDEPGVRLVVLHAASGVGKTSLLHAGVIPFLEEECAGFRALRDHSEGEGEGEGEGEEQDYPVLSIRATGDLAGQLALSLYAWCARPYRWTTPTGKAVEVDLPAILRAAVPAQQPPAAGQEEAIKATETPSGPPLPGVGAPEVGEVREALRRDPGLFGRLLAALTERLPHELVVMIEQGEEVFTLGGKPGDARPAARSLALLRGVTRATANARVIVSLQTEYQGRLMQGFPEPQDRERVRTYLLRELTRNEMREAILLPTATQPIPGCSEVSHAKYGFRFEEGIPERLVEHVIEARERRGEPPLPLLQVVCAQLYRVSRDLPDRVVRANDVDAILLTPGFPWGRLLMQLFLFFVLSPLIWLIYRLVRTPPSKVPGSGAGLSHYVGFLLGTLFQSKTSSERTAFEGFLEKLQSRQPDGSAICTLLPEAKFSEEWKGSTPFETILEAATGGDARLLAEEWLDVGGQEGRYISLGHAVLAPAVAQLANETRRREQTRARVADTLWLMIPLLILAFVWALTWIWKTNAWQAEYTKLEVNTKRIDKERNLLQGEVEEARWQVYAGHISQARDALQAGDLLRSRQLLLTHKPNREKADRRGFEWFYLWGQLDGARDNLLGHRGRVTAVALAPDGKVLASASDDGTVKLWDVANGVIRATLRAHKGGVRALAFAPNGATVATAGGDGAVLLWDATVGKDKYTEAAQPREQLPAGNKAAAVHALAFAPDGKTLAAAGGDGAVRLWDVSTAGKAKEQAPLDGGKAAVYALAYAPDGKTLAAGGADAGVKLWDVTTAGKEKVRETLKGANGPVRALAYTADGKALAAGGEEIKDGFEAGFVRLWDAAKGKELTALDPAPAAVASLAFAGDGKTLATGGKDDVVRLWDAATGRPRGTLRGHLGWAWCVAFSADGKTVASGGLDRAVKLWDLGGSEARDVLRGHTGWVNAVAMAPDGKRLASGGADGTVRLWDLATGKGGKVLKGHQGAVLAVAWSPDGKRLASGGADKLLRLWDTDPDSKALGTEQGAFKGHEGEVTSLVYSENGKFVASGCVDGSARLWGVDPDVKDQYGKAVRRVKAGRPVRAVAFLPFTNSLAIAGDDRGILVLDVATGKEVSTLLGHTAAVRALTGWPGAKDILFSGAADRTIKVWDAKDGKEILTLRGHGAPVSALAISAGEPTTLVSGGWDGTVRFWNPQTRGLRFTLQAHEGPVQAVAVSPDGHTVASAGRDGTVRLWRGAKETSAAGADHP